MAWVFLGISPGLRPREIPRKTHAISRSDEKSITNHRDRLEEGYRRGMGCVIEGNSGNRCTSLADLHLVLGSAGGQAGAKIYLPPNCQGQLELYISQNTRVLGQNN